MCDCFFWNFHDSRSVFMVLKVPGWFLMVPGCFFLWFFKVQGQFFTVPGMFLGFLKVPSFFPC